MKITKFITGILLISLLVFPVNVRADEISYDVLPSQNGIDMNKEWKVNFNVELDPSTVNQDNFKVRTSNGRDVGLKVKLDETNPKSVLIDLPTLGYVPGKTYTLYISKDVKSASGKNLSKPVKMDFTISKYMRDGSRYENLPVIEECEVETKKVVPGDKISISIDTSWEGEVQYRIYLYKFNYTSYTFDKYREITDDYTHPQDASQQYIFNYDNEIDPGDYKVVIYVKRASSKGEHQDDNTYFDNYSTCYFRCGNDLLKSSDNENIVYKDYDITLNDIVDKQYKSNTSIYSIKNYPAIASKKVIEYYMNPENFMDDQGKYMFMRLDQTLENVTADDINKVLEGKGTLEGMGQAFIDAANKYKINVVYLVCHALHETGNGTSTLASGNLKVNGRSTYNFFGIKAVDSNPNRGGSSHAGQNGWYTKEAAIEGGAEYIALRYIYGSAPFFDDRKTLYSMKWNPSYPASYQYATGIVWAYKISMIINSNFSEILSKEDLTFEIPRYAE